jgi:hypothetical protein
VRAYHGTLRHFYYYFIEKARSDLANDQRGEALKAVSILFANMPLLVMADLVRPSELRVVIGDAARPRAGGMRKS